MYGKDGRKSRVNHRRSKRGGREQQQEGAVRDGWYYKMSQDGGELRVSIIRSKIDVR